MVGATGPLSDWPLGANDGAGVRIRRDLHSHPELGYLEYRTAAKAASRLSRLGYEVKAGPQVMVADEMLGRPSEAAVAAARSLALAEGVPPEWVERMPGGQTGLVAELRRGTGPVLAFRFDMDALPVPETKAGSHRPNGKAYRSRHDGLMHACAHDGHTAGVDQSNPATHAWLSTAGAAAAPGWPDNPKLEALRVSWLSAPDPKPVAEEIQREALQDVPYVPIGQYLSPTAYRRTLSGVLRGFPVFWNVRRV